MYCLSSDGLRLIDAKNFYIKEVDYCTIMTKPGEIKFAIFADDCIMDVSNTISEAKNKLKLIMHCIGAGKRKINLYNLTD